MIGIYKITNPKGKIYIGQSVDIKKRFRVYRSENCKTQIKLYNSFLKYGVENHKFDIIEKCSVDLLNEKERYWQDFYKVIKNGLNLKLTNTKSKSGYLSEETKLKISESNSKMTEETKRKIGDANRGKKRSKEFKLKCSERQKGKKLKESTKKKISEKLKGKKRSEEFKLKCSISKKGVKINSKHKCKIVLDFNTGVYYNSLKELCALLDVNRITFYDHITGKTKTNKYPQYKYV